MSDGPGLKTDIWSEWLLHDRHAGNAAYDALVEQESTRLADRVLDGAQLVPGMRLLDVGTGRGLLAFGAIARIGHSIHVLATDISPPLLRCVEREAVRRQVEHLITFIEGSAEKLAGIADSSVDAVVTRASIAYVADKRTTFREFFRVLKPGGRLSLCEPIFQDEALAVRALKRMVERPGSQPPQLWLTLLHRWKAAQFPDDEAEFSNNPLVNFSERDLFEWARAAGYANIHLELHVDLRCSHIDSWSTFLGSSPHPWAPTLDTILTQRFSPDERRSFEALVRPAVESGRNQVVNRNAFLTAMKPA